MHSEMNQNFMKWYSPKLRDFISFCEMKKFHRGRVLRLFTLHFWNLGQPWWWGSQQQRQVALRVWVRVQRAARAYTAPGKLGLEKACQGNPARTPILLLLRLSNLDFPWWSETQPQRQGAIKPRVGVKRGNKPRAPGTLGLETVCREGYGRDTTLLPSHLAD